MSFNKNASAFLGICISPASFWLPDHIPLDSAWLEHAPFAFWLIDSLRPRTFVELGTHRGFSYFSFCQAVERLQLETRCYAVDTWTGDDHAGFYRENVFREVCSLNERRYSAFSTLVRSTFDEASRHFADGTIDLLHIDGRHFFNDVKHDFETWRSRLSDRAIVLFHDINVRERDFGVFRIWNELREVYPHFEFSHCHGLGVLGVGQDLPSEIQTLLAPKASAEAHTDIQRAYARLGSTVTLQLRAEQLRIATELPSERNEEIHGLQQALSERAEEIGVLQQALAERIEEIGGLQQVLSERTEEIGRLQDELSGRGNEIGKLEQALAEKDAKVGALDQALTERSCDFANLRQALIQQEAKGVALSQTLSERKDEVVTLQTQFSQLQSTVSALYRSTSWRITAPLRFTKRQFERFRSGDRNFRTRSLISLVQWRARRLLVSKTPSTDVLNEKAASPSDLSLEPVVVLDQMRQATSSLCIVLPVISTNRIGLQRSIHSVLRQTDPTWELLLVSDANHRQLAEEWLDIDWRVRVIDLDKNCAHLTSVAEFATTEFLGSITQGDAIDDDLIRIVMQRLQRETEIDIVYTDEARDRPDGTIGDPFYKPDWSPEHQDSVNYIGRFVAIRKSLLLDIRAPLPKLPEAADYVLLLEATRRARKIVHIDEVLYVNASRIDQKFGGFFTPDALHDARAALEQKVHRENPFAKVSADSLTGALDVEWPVPAGAAVTLVILTGLTKRNLPGRGDTILVANFVRSIVSSSSYANFKSIVVVDDDRKVPEDLRQMLADHGHDYRTYKRTGPFSFANKVNFAVNLVADGIVLLLNDDLEVVSQDWIQRLAGLAARPAIGVVGARLLYSDGTIQHAGIALGFHGSAGHMFHRAQNDGREYGGFASIQRNFSAVTGAVMAFRKRVFDEMGGFDERLSIDYNDLDFCLRCIEAGYRVVQAPAATLYHYHNSSLQRTGDNIREREIFCARWRAAIDRDPHYSRYFQKRHDELPILEETTKGDTNKLAPIVEQEQISQKAYTDLLAYLFGEANTLATTNFGWKAFLQGSTHQLTQQIHAILRLGLFDRAFYLAKYPDVCATGTDPLVHYVRWGEAEGRWPNPIFDPVFYRKQVGQAALKNVLALYHYATTGEAAGQSASALFNPKRYLVSNPDIAPWLDHPLTHYLWLGRPAGLSANRKTRLSATQTVIFEKNSQPDDVDTGRLRCAANIIGPLDRVSGLGVSARGYLEAVGVTGFARVGARVQTREFGIQKPIQGTPQFPDFISDAAVNIFHMNGDTLPAILEDGGAALFENRYNIAVWYWELATFRPEWQRLMKLFHEFWAPSAFIARALGRCTTKPVRLVPPYLSYLRRMTPGAKNSTNPHFVYCFDANSILERKNPTALLEAFGQAFPKRSNARLTFKITYPNRQIADVDRLYEARDADPRITIIDDMLSDAELHGLVASATAYVSPHRSEGLGLTVIEAMASTVPVIATPYGGVDQFVTSDLAYPIDFRMIELTEDYEPYPKGFTWADPDVESIARLLRDVVERPVVARARAVKARTCVLDIFASSALIETYSSELDRIGRRLFNSRS
jgi:O-antigen biosynthesis protein